MAMMTMSALLIPGFVPMHYALHHRIVAPFMSATDDSKITHGKVHGEGGAFVAGYWVPIAECADKFNIEGGSNENSHADTPCPRSRTRHSAAKDDGTYDVVIIGAGCIGSAIARELSKTQASVLLLEAGDDVCQGATKGNSGSMLSYCLHPSREPLAGASHSHACAPVAVRACAVVHAGFDDKPGTNRARLCWKGNQMFTALDEDLHFGFQLTGSLVCARGEEEEKHLEELLARGDENGVENLRLVKGDELKKMEPHLDEAFTAALHSPDAGTLIPCTLRALSDA